MKKKTIVPYFFMVMIMVLAACNATGNQAGSATNQESPAAQFPTGKFTAPDDQYSGFYYYDDGTSAYFQDGSILVEGTYTIDGDILTDTVGGLAAEEEGCGDPATYRWSYDGTNLKFALVGTDNCPGRNSTMDGSTWVYAGPAPAR
jgi:hypothetical protein